MRRAPLTAKGAIRLRKEQLHRGVKERDVAYVPSTIVFQKPQIGPDREFGVHFDRIVILFQPPLSEDRVQICECTP